MNLKNISWNVKGLNDRDKRLQVRNLVQRWGPEMGTILRLMGMLTWGMAIQEVQKMNITNQLNNEQAAKLAAKAEDVSGCVHYLPCFLLPPKLV